MSHTFRNIGVAASLTLLVPAHAAAQAQVESADAGVTASAEEPTEDAGAQEPELDAPFVPETAVAPSASTEVPYDDVQAAKETGEEDLPDGKPFAKGDMEAGLGFGFAGYDSAYFMIVGGSFAYYVANRFAPGIEVSYGTDFGSSEIPDDLTLLPFAKFVILRSTKFAPYLIGQVGREFEFAGDNAVHSWIVGMGAGAHIGLGSHFMLKIEVTFQHHWYDDKRIRGYDDDSTYRGDDGYDYLCDSSDACDLDGWVHDEEPVPGSTTEVYPLLCNPEDTNYQAGNTSGCVHAVDDKKDIDREWIYPIVSIGAAFSF